VSCDKLRGSSCSALASGPCSDAMAMAEKPSRLATGATGIVGRVEWARQATGILFRLTPNFNIARERPKTFMARLRSFTSQGLERQRTDADPAAAPARFSVPLGHYPRPRARRQRLLKEAVSCVQKGPSIPVSRRSHQSPGNRSLPGVAI
jgi:hypothetical protein